LILDNEETAMLPSELLHIHREEIRGIVGRYPRLSNLRVVGSVARGEDNEGSDVDFLVDLASGATLFDLGGLHEDLEDLLGIPVDVISSRSRMDEYMKVTMERDAVRI
jgi:predicted nucleotidyltransferase